MINDTDLHILTQNNMHTSNDVFSGSKWPVIKMKVLLNDCIVNGGALKWCQVLVHLQKCGIKASLYLYGIVQQDSNSIPTGIVTGFLA